MSPVLEFAAVSKRYWRHGSLVLDGVSLRVDAGGLVQIRGDNGSGKSTLLRLAGGFSRPTGGAVHRRYANLGFVPDRVTPPARMTGRGYLAHLGRLAGVPTAGQDALAERLGLSPGLDAPLGSLSRGNLRKVVLLQCLLRRPELVVMDEPFVALDATASSELAALVRERLDDGCAFLVATHSDDLNGLGRTFQLTDGRLDERERGAVPMEPDGCPPGRAPDVTEQLVVIELDGRHPTTRLPGRPSSGGVQYLVPSDQVEQFLQQAFAAKQRVLRLNPVEPGS